jgi:hypothetical protein
VTSPARTAQLVYNLPSSAFNEPGQKTGPANGIIMSGEVELDGGLPSRGSPALMQALKELHGAQARYLQAEHFYDGDTGDLHVSPRVQQLLAKLGANSVNDLNYAKVPVDSVADNLQVRAVSVTPGRQGGGEEEVDTGAQRLTDRATETLNELRKRNQLDAEEAVLHLSVSKHGDAYLFVWPVSQELAENELDEDQRDELDLRGGTLARTVSVDMFVNTAEAVRVFYSAENPLLKTHAIKSWEWRDGQHRATLYYPDRIERWVSEPEEDREKPEAWRPYLSDEEQQWPLPNPTGRVPFFHFRTRRTYGAPEHESAYGPQQLINKLVSAHAGTIDFNSFPQRYILLNPKLDDTLMNLVDPDYPEDEDDDPEGDGRSQFRSDPSAIWKIPGATGVGQFAAADPAVFMTPLDRYIRSMAELTKTPLDEFVGYGQALSGEARKYGRKPLTDKLRNRSRSYGAEWQDAYEFALELLGFSDVTVNVEWAPFETASGLEDWNVVATKIAQGVPVGQALQEAGYERDVVEGWLTDETGADLTRRVALLNSIGTAVQTLGAGVGLGVVSAQQVADIVSRILGLTAEQLPALDEPVQVQPPAPPPVPGAGPPQGESDGGGQPGGGAAAPPPAPPPPPPPFDAGQGSPGPAREQ